MCTACFCCVEDNPSLDGGGGSRSMGPAQPHQVPLPSHAISPTVITTAACNVVEAQEVPAHRAAGVRLIGPSLHVVLIVGNW